MTTTPRQKKTSGARRRPTSTARASRDGAAAPREHLDWDDRVPGLALRQRPNGTERWVVVRRVQGRSVKRVLGCPTALTRAQARALALAAVEAPPPAPVPDLAALAETWLADHQPRWKPATLRANS
ncbi:MAG: hypothetical protein AAFS03_11365, partial [Pseudomonadota bacterium]